MKRLFLILIIFSFYGSASINAQVCNIQPSDISVSHWTAGKGTVANYAASVIDTSISLGLIIILGKTQKGIYTIEGGMEDDGRGGYYANLVFTSFEGKRTSDVIYNGDMIQRYLETDSLKGIVHKLVLNRLWKLAAEKKYNTDSLKPTWYSLSKADDNSQGLLMIKNKTTGKMLYWNLNARPEMCWCFYSWECSSAELPKN